MMGEWFVSMSLTGAVFDPDLTLFYFYLDCENRRKRIARSWFLFVNAVDVRFRAVKIFFSCR